MLLHLGFREDWAVQWTDQPPGYLYDFGSFTLSASELTNEYLQPTFVFRGLCQDARTITSIEFAMPMDVESIEQGTAWIVDSLDRQRIKAGSEPDWVKAGRSLAHHLPWVRRLNEFSKRPTCTADKAWLVALRQKLREIPSTAAQVTIYFDGEFIRLNRPETSLAVAASGAAPSPGTSRTRTSR